MTRRFLTVLLLSLSFEQNWRILSSHVFAVGVVVLEVTTAAAEDDQEVAIGVTTATAVPASITTTSSSLLDGGTGAIFTRRQQPHQQHQHQEPTMDNDDSNATTTKDDILSFSINNNNDGDYDDSGRDRPNTTSTGTTTTDANVPPERWEIINRVDPEALQTCLQRRDLEEVFGLEMGVICTCITANTVVRRDDNNMSEESEEQESDNEDDENNSLLQGRKDVSNLILSSPTAISTITVQIVVQLSCTDSRSRFNNDGVAGQFSYCIPKDDICGNNNNIEQECCGNRICDLHRGSCVALPSTTSTRYNGQYYKLGGNNNGSVRHDNPSREKPQKISSFLRRRQAGGDNQQ
jgi:hypothetical protein